MASCLATTRPRTRLMNDGEAQVQVVSASARCRVQVTAVAVVQAPHAVDHLPLAREARRRAKPSLRAKQ